MAMRHKLVSGRLAGVRRRWGAKTSYHIIVRHDHVLRKGRLQNAAFMSITRRELN